MSERVRCDVLIVGDSLGGCAAAMRLARMGVDAILLSENPWIGGQMTSQAVPPDEHPWIEEFGCTALYREYRNRVRAYYRDHMDLTPAAKADPLLNPGMGWVSRLCHDPRIAHAVLQAMLLAPNGFGPRLMAGRLDTGGHDATAERVNSLQVILRDGTRCQVEPKFVLDASDTDDLLGWAPFDWSVSGAESRAETGEPHAPDEAHPARIQAVTWVAAFGWDAEGDHTIERPASYDRWRNLTPPYWPDKQLSFFYPNVMTGEKAHLPLFDESMFCWFTYRQIIDQRVFAGPVEPVTLVNWPQNDQVSSSDPNDARDLTLSLLYWLQTEEGFRGLRLRPDVVGTHDGLAQAPYIRETRRMKTMKTLREQDVSAELNPGRDRAEPHGDSVGVGAYRIDLHPSVDGGPTLDLSSIPFQVPLGCLIPQQVVNIIPAAKNIGATHISNGCTRLHPVEWNIGESAAVLAGFCLRENLTPQQVYADPDRVRAVQEDCLRAGIEIEWPADAPLRAL